MSNTVWDTSNATRSSAAPSLRIAVPFFGVKDITASIRFYVDGLGFNVTRRWEPDGRLRWCWIERDQVALMLQEYWKKGEHGDSPGPPEGPLGQGVSICIICDDAIAIYKEAMAKGLVPGRPFVGNGMWVTSIADPDGFRLEFESPTDAVEDTQYQEGA